MFLVTEKKLKREEKERATATGKIEHQRPPVCRQTQLEAAEL